MTAMRNQAKQLDETQGRLSEELDAWKDSPRQTLRGPSDRQQIQQTLEQQEKKLDQLVDQMRRTVGEAEETEPLLARNLFDAVRKADEQKIPGAIEQTRKLAEAGFAEEASKSSRLAGEGIGQLRQGVERAARSVLGDETAALRLAQSEVEQLANQVDREIARATGEPPGDRQQPGQTGRQAQQGGQGQNNRQAGQATPPAERSQPADRGQQGQQGRQRQRGQQRPTPAAGPGSTGAGSR